MANNDQQREEEANDPLLQNKTSNQGTLTTFNFGSFGYLDNFAPLPPFGHAIIDRMLCEPKVNIGLNYLKGPIISDTQYEVVADHPEIQAFVQDQLEKFMARGMIYALLAIDRGFSANEILYEKVKGKYSFKELVHIPYQSAQPYVQKGKVVSIEIKPDAMINDDDDMQSQMDRAALITKKPNGKNVVSGRKKFWTVHNRHLNCVWGRSHLFGAHIPYHSLCSNGGVWEGINLWMRKNAFDGGRGYYPEGYSTIGGVKVHNREVFQRAIDLMRTGGSMCLPSAYDERGNRLWEFEPPASAELGATHLQWHDMLGDQIHEGLGVPPDLTKGSDAGGGNNKRVTQTAFYTFGTDIATYMIHDFSDQSIKPNVELNFKGKVPPELMGYEIKKIKLMNAQDSANLQNQMGNLDENGEEKKENNNPMNNGEIAGKPKPSNDQNMQNPQNGPRKAS
jgi:hypothetical protein